MRSLILLTSLVLSTTTFAATSGTLLLQGVVPQKLSISVSAEAASSALDLTTSQTDLKVASVNEKSNSKSGYTVSISSANHGSLKRTDGPEVFAYSMKYGGMAIGLETAGATLSQPSAAAVNVNRDLAISYTGIASESMVEGTYSDTLTLNIAAN